jgi:hypothetical protein
MPRSIISPDRLCKEISVIKDRYRFDKVTNLYASLALPSYVHGYSLGIEYMYHWFKSKFPDDFSIFIKNNESINILEKGILL